MKIVDLNTFRSLPPGTVFLKYDPQIFGDLCVKGETWEVDFTYCEVAAPLDFESGTEQMDVLDRAPETGESLPMDFDIYSRDGYFEDNQLFAVYEKQDVEGLIEKLQRCLKESHNG